MPLKKKQEQKEQFLGKRLKPDIEPKINDDITYKIEFTPKADRIFSKLPESLREEITLQIDELSKNPRPPGVKKLKGGKNEYRIRIKNYRVIYSIEDSILLIIILNLGDRKDIYKDI